MRRRVAMGVMALLLAAPVVAGADPASRSLFTLRAPAGCPGQDALVRRIERDLGQEQIATSDAAAVSARVNVSRGSPGHWVGEVQIHAPGGGGSRRLTGARCDEVIEAAALEIALAIGDARPTPAPAPATEGLASASKSGPPPAAAPPRRPPEADSAEPETPAAPFAGVAVRRHATRSGALRLAVRADVLGDAGSLPGATAGTALAVDAGLHWVSLEAWAGTFLSRSAAVGGGASAEIHLWSAGLRACGRRGALALCAGGEAGRMHARGVNLGVGRSGFGAWGAASASLWWRRHLAGPAALACAIEGLVPLARPRFVLDSGDVVHQPSPVAVRALVGLELRL